MKYINIKSIILAVAAMIAMSSCTGDQAMPPFSFPAEMGDQEMGNGTWDHPMAAYMIALGNVPVDEDGEKQRECWVSGYIVGWINVDISTTDITQSAVFTIPADKNLIKDTNLIIASRPDETNPENVVSVQLPNTEVRAALNLKDNPENLGELITIYGTVGQKYCGTYGVRSVSEFNWGDLGIEPDPNLVYQADLKKDTQNFTFKQTAPASGMEVWTQSTKYGIVARGYNGSANVESDATAISPAIDLRNRKSATLIVNQAANYFGGASGFLSMCTIMVREVGTTEWETLTIPTPPNGNSWDFNDSGDISLDAYLGKKVEIGFHYTSTTSLCGTWEIARVTVKGEKTEN